LMQSGAVGRSIRNVLPGRHYVEMPRDAGLIQLPGITVSKIKES